MEWSNGLQTESTCGMKRGILQRRRGSKSRPNGRMFPRFDCCRLLFSRWENAFTTERNFLKLENPEGK